MTTCQTFQLLNLGKHVIGAWEHTCKELEMKIQLPNFKCHVGFYPVQNVQFFCH